MHSPKLKKPSFIALQVFITNHKYPTMKANKTNKFFDNYLCNIPIAQNFDVCKAMAKAFINL
jgi:hypothetical protein